MGTADAVPGVSGGTIALITGIYQRLIESLSSPDIQKFKRGLAFTKNKDFDGLKELMQEMDVHFLIVLGAGVVSAIIVVLNLMDGLIESNPVSVFGFFTGLILISAIILYREVELQTKWSKLSALIGFWFALLVAGIGANTLGHTPLVLFVSGALAISAMILPGISGSLILVVLGQYEYMSNVVSSATDAVLSIFTGVGQENLLETVFPAGIFILGAITGIFSMVRIVEKSLERNREATMAFLVSLMLGSLRAPLTRVDQAITSQGTSWMAVAPEFLLAVAVGGALIYILDSKTITKEF